MRRYYIIISPLDVFAQKSELGAQPYLSPAMLALRRLVPLSRSLHTSSSGEIFPSQLTPALRKAKAPVDDESMELDDELFDGTAEPVAETTNERSTKRALIMQEIFRRTPGLRVGALRKVVQLSDTPADLEELARVLREWRVSGRRVTRQTGEELVGEYIACCPTDTRPMLEPPEAGPRQGIPDKHGAVCVDTTPALTPDGLPPLSSRMQEKLDKKLQ